MQEFIIHDLCKKGVDVNSPDDSGNTPLHYASRRYVQLGVALACNLFATSNSNRIALTSSVRCFHHANCSGVLGIVKILVEHKGDIMAKNSTGMTPLHVACNNGHVS